MMRARTIQNWIGAVAQCPDQALGTGNEFLHGFVDVRGGNENWEGVHMDMDMDMVMDIDIDK